MFFTYAPEGADTRKWVYEPLKLLNAEAEAIERHTGMEYMGEFQKKLGSGSVLAFHGLLFVLLKRDNPTLRWDQVQFAAGEVGIEFTDEEQADVVAALEAKAAEGPLSDDEQEALDAMRAELADTATAGELVDPKAAAGSSSG